MFLPIGSFLTRMDAALIGSMDGIIASMTSAMATPVAAAAIVYYAVQGLRLANGDSAPLQNFVPQLIRVGTVIWLSSNLGAFNQWVRDIFFTGLPNALGAVIANSTGATGNSLGATAAIFDNIWSQIWIVVGGVWAQAGFSTAGAIAGFAGILAAIFGTLGLLVLALVYICARMVLAVIVCLAPAIIGCAMFDATRPIFERALGKVVALIILQTAGLIVLQIVLMGDQWFIAQLTTASLNALAGGSALSDEIEILVALVVWFAAGAFAIYNLPAVAYSIGSGVALSGPSLLLMANLMRSMRGGGGNGGARPGGGDPRRETSTSPWRRGRSPAVAAMSRRCRHLHPPSRGDKRRAARSVPPHARLCGRLRVGILEGAGTDRRVGAGEPAAPRRRGGPRTGTHAPLFRWPGRIAMNDAFVPPGYVPRGEGLAEVTRAVAAARGLERERRIRRLVTIGGGWAVAVFMTVVAAACLAVMWVRPAPRDLLYVAVVHDDGTFDPPRLREDLSRSQRDMLFRHTVIQYVFARENYSWEGVNATYQRASAMSAPAERDRYQAVMFDKRNPENPAVVHGEGLNAAAADVTAIQVRVDPAAPNAVDAMFVVRITAPGQAPRTIRKTARMTWMPAEDRIPPEVQQVYDPAGIAFTHYSSTPDPDATR